MNHPDSIRLNKAIASSGYCSRREADVLIENGRVTVNGKKAGLGDRVLEDDEIRIDGKVIQEEEEPVYIILNKPAGITSTTRSRFNKTVVDFIGHPSRIFPVGRLDKDSEGLLLLTNDGSIVNKILRSANAHEKEYQVRVNKPVTPDFIKRMASGVPILNTVTRKCKVVRTGEFEFRIVLTQGLNRQIRRMCEYLGYRVVFLKRIRLMHLNLSGLETGRWRELTSGELKELKAVIKHSDQRPHAERAEARSRNTRNRPGNRK